jgi:hypothetical protein
MEDRKEINPSDMTFKQLYEEFYEYKSDKVKHTTMRTYRERVKYFTIFDNINLLAERNNQLDTNLNDLRSEFGLISSKLDNLKSEPIESEFGTNPKEYINNIVKESISENIGNINKEIEQSFSKQSDLFTRQFENKIKFMIDSKK